MEKFNYKITIEGPDREFADAAMRTLFILNENIISEAEPLPSGKPKEKKAEPEKRMGEKILEGLSQFEKYLHIIKCCAEDESLLDRLSQVLGYKKQKAENDKQV